MASYSDVSARFLEKFCRAYLAAGSFFWWVLCTRSDFSFRRPSSSIYPSTSNALHYEETTFAMSSLGLSSAADAVYDPHAMSSRFPEPYKPIDKHPAISRFTFKGPDTRLISPYQSRRSEKSRRRKSQSDTRKIRSTVPRSMLPPPGNLSRICLVVPRPLSYRRGPESNFDSGSGLCVRRRRKALLWKYGPTLGKCKQSNSSSWLTKTQLSA